MTRRKPTASKARRRVLLSRNSQSLPSSVAFDVAMLLVQPLHYFQHAVLRCRHFCFWQPLADRHSNGQRRRASNFGAGGRGVARCRVSDDLPKLQPQPQPMPPTQCQSQVVVRTVRRRNGLRGGGTRICRRMGDDPLRERNFANPDSGTGLGKRQPGGRGEGASRLWRRT